MRAYACRSVALCRRKSAGMCAEAYADSLSVDMCIDMCADCVDMCVDLGHVCRHVCRHACRRVYRRVCRPVCGPVGRPLYSHVRRWVRQMGVLTKSVCQRCRPLQGDRGSILASPTACPLRGYGRAGTQNDRLGVCGYGRAGTQNDRLGVCGDGRAGTQNDRLSEAVISSTGSSIPARWTTVGDANM